MKNVTIKKVKKAFTLVELLVVIAILAILGTVGIVGYTAFINKANQSNDQTVISELNTFVKAADIENEIDTVSEANDALFEEGFSLKTLKTTTKNYRYGYDAANKEFCLIDKEWNLVNYSSSNKENIFAFVDSEDDLSTETITVNSETKTVYNAHGFSIYLQKNFSFNSTSININKGIDTGSNKSFKTINYLNDKEQNVLISTNSAETSITVNGYVDSSDKTKGDKIFHYGRAGSVTLSNVAEGSYYEYGTVPFVELTTGRIVLTEDSDVETINVTKSTESTYNNPIMLIISLISVFLVLYCN